MKERCQNPNSKSYKNYGARGIQLCEEWRAFEVFKAWAEANGYSEGLTIDRIDNDGNYEPSNCRWATMETQNNNSRNNHLLSYGGRTMSLTMWAKELGINPQTLHTRIVQLHWPVERALGNGIRKHVVRRGKNATTVD
jgi:hypothetical protein